MSRSSRCSLGRLCPPLRQVLVILAATFGFVLPATAVQPPVLVVLGDSLSSGYGLALDSGWVNLLAERLRTARAKHTVVNASISGDTTEGGRSRVDQMLATHLPAIVVIELGGNDGLRGIPLSRTAENLEFVVRRCLSAGARVLLVGVRLPPNYGPVFVTRFAKMFTTVAARTGVPLVPQILAGVGERQDLMQSDGIHPVAEAQPRMLENVWTGLLPLLEP